MLPWKETSVESERLRFIERHRAGEETVAELCRRFGISRKTGYKLIGRYRAYGDVGLLNLSRAPHHHPNATPTAVAERIVEAKGMRPTWGPKKIVAWLRSVEPDLPWPSPTTASGEPSTASGTATTTTGHTRPWDSDLQACSTRPRSDPTPHTSAPRSTVQESPYEAPQQRREQVEGRTGIHQCLSQR